MFNFGRIIGFSEFSLYQEKKPNAIIFNNRKTNENTTTATKQEREVRQVDRWVEFSGQGPCGAEAPRAGQAWHGALHTAWGWLGETRFGCSDVFTCCPPLLSADTFLWASLSPTG